MNRLVHSLGWLLPALLLTTAERPALAQDGSASPELTSPELASPAAPSESHSALRERREAARRGSLRGFSPSDRALIGPLLDQGTVGLVELPSDGRPPPIHLARRVQAPAALLFELLSHPGGYPNFMPAMTTVQLSPARGSSQAFSWRWTTSIFGLNGRSMMTSLQPRPDQVARGYRVVMERLGGDLGVGREVWRIIPEGPESSLLLVSSRMDLRDANYLTRQAGAARSLSRSINLTMAFATLLRIGGEAERRSATGEPATARPTRPLHRPEVNLESLRPLLHRGDLLLIESSGSELSQAAVMSLLPRPEAHVRNVMLDPIAFTEALIAGSEAEVRSRGAEGTHFDWRVDLPLIGSSGSMVLGESEQGTIALDALSGAMAGGHFRYQTHAVDASTTLVLGWARFDIADANALLRAVANADPGLQVGLSAATEVMMARALRIRVQRPWSPQAEVPSQ